VDEYKGVAGIYEESTGSRLRLTPSLTWGDEMLVPADAEVVAEGYIYDRKEDTGHWCDVWQNYTPPSKQNVFRVEALTMRRKPMFNSNWPSASIMNSITEPAEIYTFLKPVFPGIKSVSLPYIKTLVISARLQTPALAMNLGASVFALGHDVKTVILVDEDVDPYDLRQVMFSLTSRVDATRDVQVLPVKAHPNDPSATGPTVGGLIINAMKREDTPEFEIGMPPRSMIEEVRSTLDPAILQRVPAGSRLSW
jgi:UbiD family decarboxylase